MWFPVTNCGSGFAGNHRSKAATSTRCRQFLAEFRCGRRVLLALDAASAPRLFEQIKRQIDELITLLEANPGIGRPARFNTTRSIQSRAASAPVEHLAESMHVKALREYVLKDHVVLYAELEAEVVLLALKHQRQLQYHF